jgi:O-antigen/teichoic acid export membrane protein
MIRFRRALLFSFSEKYSLAAFNLAITSIVAHLFTPGDLGILTIAASITTVLGTLRDCGVSNYLLQAQHLPTTVVRTAFTVTLLLSLFFALVVAVLADPIAVFYADIRLRNVLFVSAVGFLAVPFSSVITALLRRELAFHIIALTSIVGALVSLGGTIAVAALSLGVTGLVWAGLLAVAASTVLAFIARPNIAVFRPSLEGWRRVVSFGGYSSLTALLNILSQSLLQLIIGWSLGLSAVAIYTRATGLSLLFDRLILDALNPVVLPALAANAHADGDMKSVYLRSLTYSTVFYWPFLIFLALMANPIVMLLLGPQWPEVGALVRIMALASLCLFAAFLTFPLLVSLGHIRDTLTMSLVSIPPSLIIITVASFWGLSAAAASSFVVYPLQVLVALHFLRKRVPFTIGELGTALWKSAVVTACAAIVPSVSIALSGFRFDQPLAQMVIAGSGAVVGWLLGTILVGHPILNEVRGLATSPWRRLTAE